jgi:hypothetical protein
LFCCFPPVTHPYPRNVEIASRDRLPFVADGVDRDNSALLHEKPHHSGIELADVAQFEKSAAKRLGQWLAVILAVSQFRETGDHRREVIRIAGRQLVEKFPHRTLPRRRFIKLYYEIHRTATSNLMYINPAFQSFQQFKRYVPFKPSTGFDALRLFHDLPLNT